VQLQACEHSNEPLGSIKCREFPDQLNDLSVYETDLRICT
jgi:hypothetical protein